MLVLGIYNFDVTTDTPPVGPLTTIIFMAIIYVMEIVNTKSNIRKLCSVFTLHFFSFFLCSRLVLRLCPRHGINFLSLIHIVWYTSCRGIARHKENVPCVPTSVPHMYLLMKCIGTTIRTITHNRVAQMLTMH